jgi:ActR/RegA family two-component response regulator
MQDCSNLNLVHQLQESLATLFSAILPPLKLNSKISKMGVILNLLNWISGNAEWFFSGLGVAVLVLVVGWFQRRPPDIANSPPIKTNNHQTVTVNIPTPGRSALPEDISHAKPKATVSILFIDDDVKFQVVNILKRNGWTNTRIIKDVTSLEQPEVASANIFFVDIQGVGISLGFKDQGLGLVIALRKKYPYKKIVIYSAENANAFHSAFAQANERISKDADPYEFMEAVERLSA